MASIHVARVGVFTVDSNGTRLDKSRGSHSIADMLNTSSNILVIPDQTIPNTSNYPNLKDYLNAEADDGYQFKHLDQTFVITYNPA